MRSKFFSFVALLAIAGAHAEDVDLEKVVGSLIAAEKAYAKLNAEKGFREATSKGRADRETLTRFCHSERGEESLTLVF